MFCSLPCRRKVLASAFSAEIGRLRDAGSAAAAAAAGGGGRGASALGGAVDGKTEVSSCIRF